jgi:WhiB family redox-sensing transcriptional regulator
MVAFVRREFYYKESMSPEDTNGDWRNKAECVKTDPELFFPVGETSRSDIDQIQKAKSFCAKCLVTSQCLQYALETNQDSGVWGGLSENERRAFKRRIRQKRVQDAIARNSLK